MPKIIKSYASAGICGTCYMELPATIEYRDDGAAYICKTCPTHGYEEAMVEKDYNFWDDAQQLDANNQTWRSYNDVTLIEITDRCNVNCKHCYHDPDNTVADPPVELIINRAKSTFTQSICLAGAEPTMREDLPEIIKGIRALDWGMPWGMDKKTVSIYTNGIKLYDPKYVEMLKASDLNTINMSVHHPEYHKEGIWKLVSKSLQNIADNDIDLGQVSFTVESKAQLNNAVDKMLWLMERDRAPLDFCVRSPAEIGVPFYQPEEVFASDIAKWFKEIANERGLSFEKHPNHGSNPYHVGHIFEGQTVQVIHWASAKSVDTTYMNMGPYAVMNPNTKATFLMAAILRDGVKNGWWQGQRLWPEGKTREVSPNRRKTKFNPEIINPNLVDL